MVDIFLCSIRQIRQNYDCYRDGVVSELEMTSKAELAFAVRIIRYFPSKRLDATEISLFLKLKLKLKIKGGGVMVRFRETHLSNKDILMSVCPLRS